MFVGHMLIIFVIKTSYIALYHWVHDYVNYVSTSSEDLVSLRRNDAHCCLCQLRSSHKCITAGSATSKAVYNALF